MFAIKNVGQGMSTSKKSKGVLLKTCLFHSSLELFRKVKTLLLLALFLLLCL